MPDFKIPFNTIEPPPETIRLGHQVEHLFLQLLQQDPAYRVLSHNLQIKDQNTTVGELDFIIKSGNVVKHVELSYKFYLIDPTISEPIHRLMGPNRGDMFFTKLEKTKHKQLPLLHSEVCRPTLEKLNLQASEIIQHVCFLGQLFAHLDNPNIPIRPLNKECIIGYWCRISDFEGDRFRESEYYIPTKREWIHIPHNEVNWTTHFETLLEINIRHINKRSPMLWRKVPNGNFEKLFVVWW